MINVESDGIVTSELWQNIMCKFSTNLNTPLESAKICEDNLANYRSTKYIDNDFSERWSVFDS
jgi:hypothetical protein